MTRQFRDVLKFHARGFKTNGARGVRNLLRKLVMDELSIQVFRHASKIENRTFVIDYDADGQIADGFDFARDRIRYEWE